MDFAVETKGLTDLRKMLAKFDGADKPFKKALKTTAKDLEDRQRAAFRGLGRMEAKAAKMTKVFFAGDVVGVRFRGTAGRAGPGMGIFAGAKRYPQFKPWRGVDPDSGGYGFFPVAREHGPRIANEVADEVDRFVRGFLR